MRGAELSLFLALVTGVFGSGCSRSTEAKSRREQESAFREAFGFAAPKEISEIKYHDLYNRNLMDGVYGQWMKFTYTEETFALILKKSLQAIVEGRFSCRRCPHCHKSDRAVMVAAAHEHRSSGNFFSGKR